VTNAGSGTWKAGGCDARRPPNRLRGSRGCTHDLRASCDRIIELRNRLDARHGTTPAAAECCSQRQPTHARIVHKGKTHTAYDSHPQSQVEPTWSPKERFP
jgi:hypothetical protein